MYTYYYCLAGYPKEFCGFERVLLFMSYLATYLLCNMPYVDDVKKISLHYLTIYPTNKPVSNSSPNAPYKNFLISFLWTFFFTYASTILTHPGKNGTAHLPPNGLDHQHVLMFTPHHLSHHPGLSQLGLRAVGLSLLCPHTRAAPDFVITMAFACGMLSEGSAFTRTSPTSSCTQLSVHYLTSPPTQPPKFSLPPSSHC